MTVKKFAISVPEDVMAAVDSAAASRRLTRSAFIASVLGAVARARRDSEVTRRINALFIAPEVVAESRKTSRALLAAASREGWEW